MAKQNPGTSIAVLINANARRGSAKVLRWVSEWLPRARLVMTHSAKEARRWLEREMRPNPPELLLGGGGDGTMVGLLNELREMDCTFPILGALPLGTGNAWANVTGGHTVRACLASLARWGGAQIPFRRFSLLEMDGRLAHFGGTGWDAEVIHDYHQVVGQPKLGLGAVPKGVPGYIWATLTKTVPRHLTQARARVRIINLGRTAYRVDDARTAQPIDASPGAVVYDGPMSVATTATTPEWGLGFKAFPFAQLVPGHVSVRVYAAGSFEAMLKMRALWKGVYPMPKMHDFLLSEGRMEFDRPMPCQMGGDLVGTRETFEFRVAPQHVRLLDWAALPA